MSLIILDVPCGEELVNFIRTLETLKTVGEAESLTLGKMERYSDHQESGTRRFLPIILLRKHYNPPGLAVRNIIRAHTDRLIFVRYMASPEEEIEYDW
ncbi:hypothetical protein EYZ11_011209 [Aspergillus tanneri]|uniref:Uncharacterized protein n=1 Tax=Aspergillus tanneri TaxID=1220188 RepID=A0A4S3J409_9EURO|nr:hypothetical protein EYZ11_011209 [Aspergillus tanneri]